jgi:carboxyl-terminal processing protease
MPNDGELVITWARFHAPTGYPLADLGVIPAYCTSGRSDSAVDAIAALRQGRLTDTATMARWRAADHSNMAGLRKLREICPPDGSVRDGEVGIAAALLRDQAAFAQALRSVQLTASAH